MRQGNLIPYLLGVLICLSGAAAFVSAHPVSALSLVEPTSNSYTYVARIICVVLILALVGLCVMRRNGGAAIRSVLMWSALGLITPILLIAVLSVIFSLLSKIFS